MCFLSLSHLHTSNGSYDRHPPVEMWQAGAEFAGRRSASRHYCETRYSKYARRLRNRAHAALRRSISSRARQMTRLLSKKGDACSKSAAMKCGGGASRVTGPQYILKCTLKGKSPQCCGGIGVPLREGERIQTDCLCSILSNTFTVLNHVAQVVLSACMPLRRCKVVESHNLGIALRNTFTVPKHETQVDLRKCMPMHR